MKTIKDLELIQEVKDMIKKEIGIKWVKHFEQERKKDISQVYKDRAFGSSRAIRIIFNIERRDLQNEKK